MCELPRSIEQFTDRDFLLEFDRSSAELRRASTLADKGNLDAARMELVNHFRNRRSPRWLYDLRDGRRGEMGQLWPPILNPDIREVTSRADLALRNILVMSPGMELRFGRDLDWVTPDTLSLSVPGNIFKCCPFMRDLAIAHDTPKSRPCDHGNWLCKCDASPSSVSFATEGQRGGQTGMSAPPSNPLPQRVGKSFWRLRRTIRE